MDGVFYYSLLYLIYLEEFQVRRGKGGLDKKETKDLERK